MGGSVKFGGYDGAWWDRYDDNTLTIGYLNRDSSVSIYNGVSSPYRANNVTKVGTANLTLGTTRIKNLTVNGGSVTMPIGIAPNTLTIAEGTELRVVGDAAWEVGTVTNLFSYTTLSEPSAGSLASQVKLTGLGAGKGAEISVEDNVVKATIVAMPTADDDEATVTKDGDNYKVEVQAETVALTVPDGVTVSEVVVSTNTTNVTVSGTGTIAADALKVAVSWTDGEGTHSANYQIVKLVDNAVLLDGTKSVTVGEEEIPVKPALSAADDEVAPFEVGDDVSVGVKAIPGLVYRLVRGTAPTAINETIVTEKATSSRMSLSDGDRPPEAAFYQVTVDVK